MAMMYASTGDPKIVTKLQYVYQLTGEEKYLHRTQRLNDEKMWIPLSQGRDILDGWHANTQIPKFTGFETICDYTGDHSFTDAAVFFWNTVVKNRSWVIGGNSTAEHFFPRSAFDEKVVEPGGPESCNSVNMMRLTETLYRDYAEPVKVDYYERVLFNHILANYNPANGMCVYYTFMRPGHYKVYSSPYRRFWCCTGTGMEAPAKFGRMIYAYKADELYVNLFIHSALHWREKGLAVEQETTFPAENATRLTIHTSKPMTMNLLIRRPRWMDTATVVLRINGALAHAPVDTQGYLVVHRRWRNGDVVGMEWKPILSVERLGDSDRYAAFLCGPIVLAARVDNHGLTKDDFTGTRNAFTDKVIPTSEAPAVTDSWQTVLAGLRAYSTETRHTSSAVLRFTLSAAGGRTIRLEPFYQIAFSRYAVYFKKASR